MSMNFLIFAHGNKSWDALKEILFAAGSLPYVTLAPAGYSKWKIKISTIRCRSWAEPQPCFDENSKPFQYCEQMITNEHYLVRSGLISVCHIQPALWKGVIPRPVEGEGTTAVGITNIFMNTITSEYHLNWRTHWNTHSFCMDISNEFSVHKQFWLMN